MVKEIALDLNEKDHLKSNLNLMTMELVSYKSLTKNLETTSNQKSLQLKLLRKDTHLLKSQLKSEKATKPKDKTFLWTLRLLTALATGYLLGNL